MTYKEFIEEKDKLIKYLEKEEFVGLDVSLEESLFFYQFVVKEVKDEETGKPCVITLYNFNPLTSKLIDEMFLEEDEEVSDIYLPKFIWNYYDEDTLDEIYEENKTFIKSYMDMDEEKYYSQPIIGKCLSLGTEFLEFGYHNYPEERMDIKDIINQ